jgi:hypothetical protein
MNSRASVIPAGPAPTIQTLVWMTAFLGIELEPLIIEQEFPLTQKHLGYIGIYGIYMSYFSLSGQRQQPPTPPY